MRLVKGQMYSIIAIIIVIPMIMFFTYSMSSSQETKTDIYKGIVAEQVGLVAESMDSDFTKAMEISGKRSLIAAVNWEILKGENLTDAIANLTTLIENGTINGTENLIMENNTLKNWSSKIAAVQTNFDTDITHGNLEINSSRFNVLLTAEINVSVIDEIMEMKIVRNGMKKSVNISILEIDDPLYTLNTYGLIHRTILEYPYGHKALEIVHGGLNSSGSCTGNLTTDSGDSSPSDKILLISDSSSVPDAILGGFKGVIAEMPRDLSLSGISCYNTGNGSAVNLINAIIDNSSYKKVYIDNETGSVWHLPFRDAVENGYYFEGTGPDIITRMENRTNTSSGGIESIVNIQELFMESLPIRENQVSVDYLYFANENYIGYEVRGFPGWFRLNCAKASEYNLNELLEYSC